MNGSELLRETQGPGLWGECRSGSRLAGSGGQGHPSDGAAWSMRPGGEGHAQCPLRGGHTGRHTHYYTGTRDYTHPMSRRMPVARGGWQCAGMRRGLQDALSWPPACPRPACQTTSPMSTLHPLSGISELRRDPARRQVSRGMGVTRGWTQPCGAHPRYRLVSACLQTPKEPTGA